MGCVALISLPPPFFVLFVIFVVKQSSMKSRQDTGAPIQTRHAPARAKHSFLSS